MTGDYLLPSSVPLYAFSPHWMGSYPLVFNSQFNHPPPFSHDPFCVQLYPCLLIPCGNTLRLFTNQNIRRTHSYHRYKFLQTKILSKFIYLFSPPSESSSVPRASFLIFNPMPPFSNLLTPTSNNRGPHHRFPGWLGGAAPAFSVVWAPCLSDLDIYILSSIPHAQTWCHLEMPYSSC